MTDLQVQNVKIEKIMEMLPHRYPFLLIDRIIEVKPDESAIALKNVTINEDYFNGHFPGKPVMPGVLILEAMAQAAAAFVMLSMNVSIEDKIVYLVSIEDAHFRKPVVPGDRVYLHITKIKSRGNVWKFKGEAKVDDQRVADATFSAMVVDK
jgi:3-hydroxyacyl-[acyl-carrier-protein] dehydratase